MMVHYVYALRADIEVKPYSDMLKIGHTGDPTRRLKAHRIGSPVPLIYAAIWGFALHSTAQEVETAAHRAFGDRWIHGEWHRLELQEICDFVADYVRGRCLFSLSTNGDIPPRPRDHSMRTLRELRSATDLTMAAALSLPTISIPDAGRLFFGFREDESRAAVERGLIPTVPLGMLGHVVPVAKLLSLLACKADA